METNENTGRLKRFFFSLLGKKNSRNLLASIVRKKTAMLPPFSFPLDPTQIKHVLVILPPKRLQVLHQLKNIVEIASIFQDAELTLLAEESCTPLAGMIEGARVFDYPLSQKKLFSAYFKRLMHQLHGTVDLCCLLTHNEDLPLLYLAGWTAAPIRIGYLSGGGSPYLNFRIAPSPDRVHLTDWNCALAEILGARPARNCRWVVAKQTTSEIDYLFKEIQMRAHGRLIGVDALYFYHRFGPEWTEACIKTLVPISLANSALYLYAEGPPNDAETEWLARYNLAVVSNLTVPQAAALVKRSEVIVTGNTLYFGLATLLDVKAIGIFENDKIASFCPKSPTVRGIEFKRSPDAETIDAVARALGEMIAA